MADVSKTVEIIFAGIDKVSDTTASIAGNIDNLAGKFGDVTQPLADMAGWVEKADAAILGLGGVMIGLSINEAAKFQTAFNEISTLFRAAPGDVDKFRSAIQDYASSSTQSIESINHAVYEAISAGVSYNQSLDLLSSSEKLAVAGKADLTQTTLALVGVMNAYGLSVKDAGDVSNVFFETVKLGQITIPELTQQIGSLTGIAGAAKIPLDTLGAAIAALTTYGLTPEKAITDLKYVIQGIIDPTNTAKAAAEQMGVKFGAAALESQGLAGVLADVQAKTGGNVEKFAQLFTSTEAMTAAILLARDTSGKFAADLAEMANRAGATDEAFRKMADNFALATQTLQNNIQLAFGKAGQELLETATGDVRALSDVFKALGGSIDAGAFDPVFDQLRAFGITAEDIFQHIAANLPAALEGIDWSRFTDSLDALKDAFGGLFDGVDLTTVEGLRAGLQKVIDIMGGLLQVGAGIVTGLKPFFDMLASGADSFSKLDASTQQSIGSILGFAQGVNAVAPAVSSLATAVDSLATVLSVKFIAGLIGAGTAATTATGVFAALGAGLTGIGAAIYPVSTAADDMVPHVDKARLALVQTVDAGTKMADGLGSASRAMTEAVAPAYSFEKAMSDANDLAKAAGVAFGDMGINIEGLQQKIVSGTSAFGAYGAAAFDIAGIFGNVADTVQTNIDKAQGYHMTLVDGVPTFTQYGNAHTAIKTKTDATKASTDAAKKAADEFKLKMEEIASDERIKTIEASVKLNVAQIEADVERFKTIWGGIDNSIKGSTTLLDTLYQGFVATQDLGKQWAIEEWIRQENTRRDALLKIQQDEAKAYVEYLTGLAQRMQSDEPLISIKADGLEPELEAFMWKILERLQFRMTQSQESFLLGIKPVVN